jgi:NADPH:quinone reductase-like Zn-dependent oxidoreductase
MKAVVYKKYGPPEVAVLSEIDKPVPKVKEVLVKVKASTVNRTDAGFRSAEYFVSRFWSGLFKPKSTYQILGCEFAGVVEAIGKDVRVFKIGDKVFGFNEATFGGHAEYLTVSEENALTHIPANVDFYNAAPISEGAFYALNSIRAANVQAGQKVLLNGATGAIGSAGLQLLKYFGAHVTAVCNTKNKELIKSLGADVVIDYEQEDFTKTDTGFDFVFDAVGKSSFGICKPLLKEKGIYISTELGKGAQNIFLALITPMLGGKKVLFPIPEIKKPDVEFLAERVLKGEYKPVIDRSYKLDQLVEAYRYVETGEKTGNVVIQIAE